MKGILTYRIKDRQTGKEENWVKSFDGWWSLFKILRSALQQRAETIHFYYSSQNKNK